MHGTKWTYLSTVVSFVMQLVLTAILARLLAPAAFGLIAMAWLVLRFGQYFAQMGIGQAIVQRQEISRAHIAAGFWSSVAVGAVFSLAVWVAAPLASVLFESPQLVPVLRAMGLTFALSGTSAAAGALLRRQMRFRGMAIADMAAYAAGYGVVGVTLALSGWGVWSLVAASLGQAAVVTVAYNALARPSVVPVLNWRPYRDLLGFGSLVSVISFLEFVNANLDTLAVGRIAGPTSLGYYSRALSLTGLPLVYMGTCTREGGPSDSTLASSIQATSALRCAPPPGCRDSRSRIRGTRSQTRETRSPADPDRAASSAPGRRWVAQARCRRQSLPLPDPVTRPPGSTHPNPKARVLRRRHRTLPRTRPCRR